jgi:glycerophosphoryl diester phosphodiesterase
MKLAHSQNILPLMPRPVIFAHRGASAYAPENTLAAFSLAVQLGADAIELDAKLSRDGQVVVIHDQTVDRTTSATGKVIEMSLAELRQLDAGSHFDIAFKDEPIPTLEQVFETVGKQIYINIELTNYASKTDDLPEKVTQLVKRHNLSQRVMFSSFNPLALRRAHRELPEVPVGLLALPGQRGAWARSWLGRLVKYQALHPHYSDVTARMVENLHRRGCRIHPFTINEVPEMQRLAQLDVDGIITGDPIRALQVLKRESMQNAPG